MSTSIDQLRHDLAELAAGVETVDLRDRAMATSRGIRTRRRIAAAVVAAVMVATAGVTYVLVPHSGGAEPAAPTPTSAHVDPRTQRIVNSAIDLPPWPGFGANCPSGVFHFRNGYYAVHNSAHTQYILFYEGGVELLNGRVTYADLDGQSPNEALITVKCTADSVPGPDELLAVRLMPDGLVWTIGYVVPSLDGRVIGYDPRMVTVSGATVLVQAEGSATSSGALPGEKQVRGYRYVDGAFQQVSGPVTFPPAPTDVRTVDLRNTSIKFQMMLCGGQCLDAEAVRMVNGVGVENYPIGVGHGRYEFGSVTFTIEQTVKVSTDEAYVVVDESGSGATTSQEVFLVALGFGDLDGVHVVEVGQDGITGIQSISSATEDTAKIRVTTSSGSHLYTYRMGPGGVFHRVT
jgi:hypothetical protein